MIYHTEEPGNETGGRVILNLYENDGEERGSFIQRKGTTGRA